MGSQAIFRSLPHFGQQIAITAILSASAAAMPTTGQTAMAIEPSPPVVSQAPPYLRQRQGPAYGRRPFRPSWDGHRRHPGIGFGYGGGFAPWHPGGFYTPPVYGSWYQRPYPYHFDYFRGRFGGNPQTRPDAMGQFGQPPSDYPSDLPETIR